MNKEFFEIDVKKTFKNTYKLSECANHFKNYGCYTKAQKGTVAYRTFWDREIHRCLFGVEIDGVKITGFHYFYLNYSPIWQARKVVDDDTIVSEKMSKGKRVFDFPRFYDWDYWWFHYIEEARDQGKQAVCLKSRRRGYSWKSASMLNRNYFLIPGSRNYAIAQEEKDLVGEGLLSKSWEQMDFIDKNTAWSKRRQVKNSTMHRRSSLKKKVGGVELEEGFMSEIIGITLTGDFQRVRGKAPELVIFEEAGKCSNLIDVWNIMLSSVEEGSIAVGQLIGFGTGGTKEADVIGLETLFKEPKGQSVYPVKNIWEEGANNTVGFFTPYYVTMPGFIDANGNSLVDKAMEFSNKEREVKRVESKNPIALAQHCAERPHTPAEALMRTGGTLFPIIDINDRLAELETNRKLIDSIYTGRFKIDSSNGRVFWYNDINIRPIMDFPYKYDNKEGGVMIFEHPVIGKDGFPIKGIYIAGTDPYAQDESTTDSLGSTFVINRISQRIVAEYTARPRTDQEYYENVRRLLKYYNAECNYENNIKGMFQYFDKTNSLYLLADTPRIISDKVGDTKIFNRKKGTPSQEPINKWARELIKNYLIRVLDEDKNITNLQYIRSIPLLKELRMWRKEGNFDRVSALGMCLILMEEYVHVSPETEKRADEMKNVMDFFNRPYNRRKI
jgi:hypothetical protein